ATGGPGAAGLPRATGALGRGGGGVGAAARGTGGGVGAVPALSTPPCPRHAPRPDFGHELPSLHVTGPPALASCSSAGAAAFGAAPPVLSTPPCPWQAPRPPIAVVPSLHRTVVVASVRARTGTRLATHRTKTSLRDLFMRRLLSRTTPVVGPAPTRHIADRADGAGAGSEGQGANDRPGAARRPPSGTSPPSPPRVGRRRQSRRRRRRRGRVH